MPKLTLSTEARKLQSLVKKPSNETTSIRYNHDFLNKYRPNVTYYLDEGTRRLLKGAGCLKQRFCDYSNKFILDLCHHSSRLEGSTFSLIETRRILEKTRARHDAANTPVTM